MAQSLLADGLAAPRLTREPFIRVEQIGKRYGSRDGGTVDAVETVSFSIAEGEFVSVVGPSGCGKTTLLKIIGGLLEPSSGTISYGGLEAGRKRPRLGMVFQDAVLLPWRTVLQNVSLPIEVMRRDAAAGVSLARDLIDWSASKVSRTNTRTSSPAACSSAPRSPGRWCTTRPSC